MFISTIEQFNDYTVKLEERKNVLGLPLHEYQALIALRLSEFREAIKEKLEEGYYLINITRVYYSQVVSILEVVARFAMGKGQDQKNISILVTFKSTDFSFVSIAKNFADLEIDAPSGVTLLPISMTKPSNSEQVGEFVDKSIVEGIQERRKQFSRNLITSDEDLKFDNTTSPSNNPSTTTTSYDSNFDTSDGPGTGRTHPDTRVDEKVDSSTDTTTDVNDDRNIDFDEVMG
ncbi:hypothetical protein [Lysinibacillus fusiformis]|uniref:hypothetical protein n=1 Tax=Lysinibacillus fusiformis TaxID=28031 RepID=UPI0011A81E38|nr:hypothetical protein [Lysinibacillus fusiformis]